jgi:hypothetical protein
MSPTLGIETVFGYVTRGVPVAGMVVTACQVRSLLKLSHHSSLICIPVDCSTVPFCIGAGSVATSRLTPQLTRDATDDFSAHEPALPYPIGEPPAFPSTSSHFPDLNRERPAIAIASRPLEITRIVAFVRFFSLHPLFPGDSDLSCCTWRCCGILGRATAADRGSDPLDKKIIQLFFFHRPARSHQLRRQH